MALTNNPNPTTTPDTDNDTPPHTRPIRPITFTNNESFKNHHHHHRHHQPPPHVAVAYRECLKNHAANIGGHALDGCGEFMPSQTATPTDPTSLKCAACGCHRNFHRREYEEYSPFITTINPHFLDFRHPRRTSPSSPSSPPPQTMLVTLSTAAHDDQQVPIHHHLHQMVATPVTPRNTKSSAENLSGRKRFRTKFSQDQKEKMYSFAEKLGWKLHKCDHNIVLNFCNEIGVARGVLKVWMHNNKNTLGRRDNIRNNLVNLNPTNMEEEEDNNINNCGGNSPAENDHEEINSGSGDANLDLDLDCNITNGATSSS
ncbi:hypothetical protein ACH5RR_035860 [Cinchona calisaya]|uniref:ZF-HD dimerization-type domain-containing protein n=1 Tax=Cinchona calisaya TaxID=153742 RepID=A0ABD2Y1H4_9GENT